VGRHRRPLAAAAVIIAAIGLGGLGHLLLSRESDRLNDEKGRLEATLSDLQAAASEKDADNLAAWAPGWPLEQVLEQVRRNMPADAWLTALDIQQDGQVELKGETRTTRSPLMFSYNLDQVPGWRRVRLARMVDQGGIIGFTVKAAVATDAKVAP
jgi:Tfp pilus assembly protein PilN